MAYFYWKTFSSLTWRNQYCGGPEERLDGKTSGHPSSFKFSIVQKFLRISIFFNKDVWFKFKKLPEFIIKSDLL